jgi:hypothetical protein
MEGMTPYAAAVFVAAFVVDEYRLNREMDDE